jgi:hypothetical protein
MTFRLWILRLVLLLIGIFFIFGIYAAMHYWPWGWVWEPKHEVYEWVLLGIYATLGVFLIWAVKNPLEHLSLIWFTFWSSIVHGGIKLFEALINKNEYGHLLGDIPAFFLIALILWYLTPRQRELDALPETSEDNSEELSEREAY